MKLSQLQLNAFQQIAKAGSLTKASAVLNLTQSALSHRLSNLEEELETALFIRHGTGVRLTDAGGKLLRYCRLQSQAEEELLTEIGPQELRRTQAFAGTIRIAGTSSLIRSVALPAIADLLRKNQEVRLELLTRELYELPQMLSNGAADFLMASELPSLVGVVEEELGEEICVLVKNAAKSDGSSKGKDSCAVVYLDHDMNDRTTSDFMKLNSKSEIKIARSYMDDIYGVIDGVEAGLGRAVVPRHMIAGRKKLKVIEGFTSLKIPIFLYRLRQPYYTKLHQAVNTDLVRNAKPLLAKR